MKKRRNAIVIMAKLITLLKGLTPLMLLAIIVGSLGHLAVIGVMGFGSLGVLKLIGEDISLSYTTIAILTVVCGCVRGVFKYAEQYLNHYIAFTILKVIRGKVFNKLRELAPAKLLTKKKGEIISMLTSDIETLEVFYAHTISPIGIAVVVSSVIISVVSVYANPYLGLALGIGYVIIGIILPIISSKIVNKTGVRYRGVFRSFNAYYLDTIKGVGDVVLNNNVDARVAEVNRRTDLLLKETKKQRHRGAILSAFVDAIISSIMLSILYIGLRLYFNLDISFGRMIVGFVVSISSFGPVLALASLPLSLTQTLASGDRMIDFMKEECEARDVTNGKDFTFETLEVKDLSFTYSDSDTPVLNNVSLNLRMGEIVGIVGESGAGKSTILNLLLRFFDISSGEILYNNISIKDINTKSLKENVSMVSQQTYLFNDTILNNILVANPKASLEEVKKACAMASIDDFISSLPDGYSTRVGELGDKISAGEKQRIGLARAFLRKSRVILLDEPTSNVDAINEGIILKSLIENKQSYAIILVSHRESTMAIANRVYRFNNGTLE